MPPFRIVVRHPDSSHHDHAWAAVGGVFDTPEDIDEVLEQADGVEPSVPGSLAPEQRVRVTVPQRLAEFVGQGYEVRSQELVVKTEGTDDAGQTIPVEHKWKDVK
jgi:hypothetical protein